MRLTTPHTVDTFYLGYNNFNENITLHFYTASSKSISESKGGQRSEHFTQGTGPIFVPSLQCPPDPNMSDNPYVECLNELILGQTECSHEDDIGIICEGTYSGIINACMHAKLMMYSALHLILVQIYL